MGTKEWNFYLSCDIRHIIMNTQKIKNLCITTATCWHAFYRLSGLLLFIMISSFSSAHSISKEEITIVDRPNIEAVNVNYIGCKAPLRPLNFIKLPIESIKPEGWIKKYLELQRDGLTGHLNEISAWLEKDNNAWLHPGGDHGWEEVPYWLKGYGDLAYILNDKKMIAETKTWIEGVFASQQPDGYFGPVNMSDGKRELWVQMVMLWCLQSYYEYSHDPRVIALMTNYFEWEMKVPDDQFLKTYWENSRGGDNLYSVLWLYNITGYHFLLDLAKKIHQNTADWVESTSLPNWHNVNIAEGFREPATYYMLTGDSCMLNASYNVFHLIRRTFGQVPGGMFCADENARMGYIDPRQGVETCGMVEQMASDEIMLCLSGDPLWANNCEDVAFNSYPAAVMPDFKALRYITCPNQVVSDSKNHYPGIANSGPFLSMNPFSSRCCQHNHSQGWPYYTEHLVLATPDNGIAIALYGACNAKVKVADGKQITLQEQTNYPFEEKVSFTIQTSKKVTFPLYLRIPSWTASPGIYINGIKINTKLVSGKYICINKEWSNNDKIVLKLPMSLTIHTWQVNKNSVSVNYGPLTLSLKIKEKYIKEDSRKAAIGDSKWQNGADASKWPTTDIYAASPWNYAIVLDKNNSLKDFKIIHKPWPADNFPFRLNDVPLEVKAVGRIIPSWEIDKTGLCGVLPDENAQKGEEEKITLIPMGAARLRISAFPVSFNKNSNCRHQHFRR